MKKLLVLTLSALLSVSAMAAKDDRYKKGEIDAETALAALKAGTVSKFGKTKFSRVITQSITVIGVHQPEDTRKATIHFSYVPKGSENARFGTVEAIQFNSDYWYFPSSNKFLKK